MVQQGLRENNESSRSMDPMPTKDRVRILLVGDPGSGKTSLVHSLISDNFEPKLPPKLEPITVPAEITPDNVVIHITDYSERDPSHEENHLSGATDAADVICIVYVAGDIDSLARVAQFWIPTVREFDEARGSYRPIILVANKIDLLPEASLSENIANIRQVFMDVEAHIKVSALTQENVVELFTSAQKAITYPIAPILDTQTRKLTKKCRNALTEIFKLNDVDNDGLLNDKELNMFQDYCFGIPLLQDSLDDLKQIIKQSTCDGIVNNSITLSGFLFLHELSIDKGRRDFTWQVLRKFNYDTKLEPPSLAVTSSSSMTATPQETSGSTGTTETNDDSDDEGSQRSSSNSPGENLNVSTRAIKTDHKGSSSTCKEMVSILDFPWLRQNPIMFKASVGITVTTFISFVVLRYLSASRT